MRRGGDRDIRWQALRNGALGLAVLVGTVGPAGAVPPGSAAAAEALATCEDAAALAGDERKAALERGLRMAEAAVAADGDDARAHFALVCNLGKTMEADGVGFHQLIGLYRLRRALDRTLELAPDDADALTAMGALLLRLPRLLGGDRGEAATLLRRALVVEPHNGTARCYLAAALNGDGEQHC